jgi:hypothetical protein
VLPSVLFWPPMADRMLGMHIISAKKCHSHNRSTLEIAEIERFITLIQV